MNKESNITETKIKHEQTQTKNINKNKDVFSDDIKQQADETVPNWLK
ncbi:hypothetical protein HOG21_01485 [bacterium]|nr:hypothetical protein [bacterium]